MKKVKMALKREIMNVINLGDLTDQARYSSILDLALASLGAKQVLRLDYECDYQGFVDVDVLLNDGRVFSYKYYYGSCSGCDDWENRKLTEENIAKEMLKEATYFASKKEWQKWRDKISKRKVS